MIESIKHHNERNASQSKLNPSANHMLLTTLQAILETKHSATTQINDNNQEAHQKQTHPPTQPPQPLRSANTHHQHQTTPPDNLRTKKACRETSKTLPKHTIK